MVNYIRTFKNHCFFYDDIRKNKLDIKDIAHSLANQCRWSGHSKRFYSVAQHSVLCAMNIHPEFEFEALMHDASEAYLVDIPRPLKPFIPDYKQLQIDVENFISDFYLLPYPMSYEVKEMDERMLVTEWIQLFDKTNIELGVRAEPIPITITPWSPERAEAEFLYIAYNYIPER